MIVASHQPNFMPYMGFFYKMYLCDVFTLSDTVGFSKSAYHNYNYFDEAGHPKKVTVPVSIKNGQTLNDAMLCDWEYNRKKLLKRIEGYYGKAPYYQQVMTFLEPLLTGSYERLTALNSDLLVVFKTMLGCKCELVHESDLGVAGISPTEQIVDICEKTGCSTYLSGDGARAYLDEDLFERRGLELVWANYQPLDYGRQLNLSVLDYLMYNGLGAPEQWKLDRERLRNGKDL